MVDLCFERRADAGRVELAKDAERAGRRHYDETLRSARSRELVEPLADLPDESALGFVMAIGQRDGAAETRSRLMHLARAIRVQLAIARIGMLADLARDEARIEGVALVSFWRKRALRPSRTTTQSWLLIFNADTLDPSTSDLLMRPCGDASGLGCRAGHLSSLRAHERGHLALDQSSASRLP
jgi:hypothetical protein